MRRFDISVIVSAFDNFFRLSPDFPLHSYTSKLGDLDHLMLGVVESRWFCQVGRQLGVYYEVCQRW